MAKERDRVRRRDFLKACAWAAAGLPVLSRLDRAAAGGVVPKTDRTPNVDDEGPMRKTVLSFFCDDTSPWRASPGAFGEFLDYVKSEGIAGESSVILALGSGGRVLSEPRSDAERTYIEQVNRAYECGIDAHMEVMTHGGRYDFQKRCIPEDAIHEGLWMHEPGVPTEDYETYFENIIAEGAKIGVRFTGLTWPGGGGPAVSRRYGELHSQGMTNLSPNCWQALLNVAKRGGFRGRTVPCFVHARGTAECMAADGECGVYDMPVIGQDWLGRWDNSPERVNPDYYITSDGQAGEIARHVREGAAYCLFHAHWQGLNPDNGCGWEAFKIVIARIKEFLGERVVWMRPSALTDRLHQQRREQGADQA